VFAAEPVLTQWPTDEDGMYQDVIVLDIDSDSADPENKNKNKNKNPTADIEHFFKPAKHVKGDKKGRRLCKTCSYVICIIHWLVLSMLLQKWG
jgi:hypothetical protein